MFPFLTITSGDNIHRDWWSIYRNQPFPGLFPEFRSDDWWNPKDGWFLLGGELPRFIVGSWLSSPQFFEWSNPLQKSHVNHCGYNPQPRTVGSSPKSTRRDFLRRLDHALTYIFSNTLFKKTHKRNPNEHIYLTNKKNSRGYHVYTHFANFINFQYVCQSNSCFNNFPFFR